MTTSRFTVGERDEAVVFIGKEYGWQLKLYGLERLRILLEVTHPDIRILHPQIFPPTFFATQLVTTIAPVANHVFIGYASEDTILAHWLARKLIAEGYRILGQGLEVVGGETFPDDIDSAISELSCQVIALYSKASISNLEVMRQCHFTLSIGRERKAHILTPVNVDGVLPEQLDRVTRTLPFIPFLASFWCEIRRKA